MSYIFKEQGSNMPHKNQLFQALQVVDIIEHPR